MEAFLPNHEKATVTKDKITNYLLAQTHPYGRAKAIFFKKYGFTAESWQIIAKALKDHAAENSVVRTEASPFGTRYVIEGKISTPDGMRPEIRSIWFVPNGKTHPSFVTAYPLKKRRP